MSKTLRITSKGKKISISGGRRKSSNVKRIRKLEKITRSMKDFFYLRQDHSTQPSLALNTLTLTDPGNWATVFGANIRAMDQEKVYLKNIQIHMKISAFSEESPINYTMFLVKVRPAVAKRTYDDFGPALSGLVQNIDFTFLNGIAVLNPERFQVLKSKRFTISAVINDNNEEESANPFASYRYINWYLNFPKGKLWVTQGQTFKQQYLDSTSNIADVPFSQRYHVFIFNNNSNLDLEFNKMDTQTIHTYYAY